MLLSPYRYCYYGINIIYMVIILYNLNFMTGNQLIILNFMLIHLFSKVNNNNKKKKP